MTAASKPRGATGAGAPRSLASDESTEVVPLEEHVDRPEAGLPQHHVVLVRPVRDQDVLQRLPLARDLHLAVAVALFELVVVLNVEPVQGRVIGHDLLDEQQAAVAPDAVADLTEHTLALQRA